ncbi:O-glucosyltransferase rumi-like isoform X2 [Mangifera indica]|uniref:O-glucosyltransferase rumi-like isoform X2 n=1 Tax=Mangifera indica TaxID=29780 RepID=UPI001CFA6C82|nr:O-glucosyltransferase rumi-like isoform X2 [Mangifera indica]
MHRFPSILHRSGLATHFSETLIWRHPFKRRLATTTILLLFLLVLVAAFIASLWLDTSRFLVDNSVNNTVIIFQKRQNPPEEIIIPLNCTAQNQTQTCPTNYPRTFQAQDPEPSSEPTCPGYFRWIHEDLRPWKVTGITREMVERANSTAHFRLIIVNNKAYIETYKKSIQTRDEFTIWGILQLLRKYPGKLPDLELMFDCDDRPVIQSRYYREQNTTAPPPLFRYCGDRWTMDIVFPDWSFWGWAEINIRPWENLLREMKEGNNKTKWMEREPYAYWKGNPFVAETRQDLLACNVSDNHDWNARLYVQDWILESQQGFKQSNLASQCTHRYLQPVQHYWPIREDQKCKSIKFSVDWGNSHKRKAHEIGKAASNFIQEELKMDYVYDYMFHLLNEYAKLLKFKPIVPDGAVEICSETMACMANGLEKKFMMESMVKGPSITSPCTIPPPYEPNALAAFYRRKVNAIRRVENWENTFWDSYNQQ